MGPFEPNGGKQRNRSVEWISRERLKAEPLIGTFLGIGSSISAQMAARIGFDWVLIDTEHGAGDFSALVSQLQAVAGNDCSPIVRVPWNDLVSIKRALDAGAAGIMVPYVNSAAEAEQAVAAIKYPPDGMRGVAKSTPAAAFGLEFEQYFAEANEKSLVVVQIETPAAAERAEEIAAVKGVDVLFVGPLDLSVNLGWPDSLDPQQLDEAIDRVIEACRHHGKAAGILTGPEATASWIEKGMSFVAVGSDGMALLNGFRTFLASGKSP